MKASRSNGVIFGQPFANGTARRKPSSTVTPGRTTRSSLSSSISSRSARSFGVSSSGGVSPTAATYNALDRGSRAAVDADRRPGDRAGARARQEGDEIADLLGRREAPDGNGRADLVDNRLGIRALLGRDGRRRAPGLEPERSADGARRNSDDADAARGELPRQPHGEVVHRRLRRAVGVDRGTGTDPVHARDVDDDAATLDEMRQSRTCGSHGRGQVQREHVTPLVVRLVVEARPDRRAADVVDEDVQPAETLYGGRDRALSRVCLEHVDLEMRQAVDRRRGASARACDEGSFAEQGLRARKADPLADARNERDLSGQTEIHEASLEPEAGGGNRTRVTSLEG